MIGETAALAVTAAPAANGASGGPGWVVAVNVVIWTGLFLYLLRLDRRFGQKGDER